MLNLLKSPVEAFQDFVLLSIRAFRNIFRSPHYADDIFVQMDVIGVGSLFIVSLIGLFSGIVMALQMARALTQYGAQGQVDSIVAITLVRELGPVLTAILVAGRNASGIASELGSMKVTEQIDAMRALGTDPIQKLVTPRLIALAVVLPLLTIISDFIGLIGGYFIAASMLGLTFSEYWTTAWQALEYNDIAQGLLKPFVFAVVIALVGCFYGMRTTGGTQGVGRSTTSAVVSSSVWIFVFTAFITYVWNRVFVKTSETTLVTPGDSTVLRFDDVSLHFDETAALDHLSFDMKPGQTYVVLGAAGSGKTMLLKVAVGLVRPDSGTVTLFGKDVTRLPEQDLYEIRARVGILFQEGGLFDSLTVAENVAYPLTNHRIPRNGGSNGNGVPAVAPRSVEDRVRESLRFVELEKTLDKFPNELSGGMRRRVGIARAVVSEPALLLYDSPTAGLDPITANTIVALILKERDLRNTATIMVTHRYQDGHLMANFRYNPNSGQIERAGGGKDVSQVSTKFLVMNAGRLVFEGTEPELQASQDSYVRKFLRVGGA